MTEFFRADLTAGTHTLVFNVTEVAPSYVFGVDFVLYNSSVDTSPKGSTVQGSTAASSHSKKHTRTIVGAVIGAVAGVVLFGVLLFLYKKSRSRKSQWDVVTKGNQ
jgi:hypothetical protein